MRTQADREDDLAIGRQLERKDSEIDALKSLGREMRHSIDMLEGAMMGWSELLDLPESCALDESDSDDIEIEVKVTWGQLRRVLGALEEQTRIINSEYFNCFAGGPDQQTQEPGK